MNTWTAEDPWAPIRVFEGKWEGEAKGQPGKGVTSREYHFELGQRFLSARNKSVYEPKSANAKPEVHEDFSTFSFDCAYMDALFHRQAH
jgi:hypothetical protein